MVSVRQETLLRKNIKAPGPELLNPAVLKNKIARATLPIIFSC
jgi:hypothetical protein